MNLAGKIALIALVGILVVAASLGVIIALAESSFTPVVSVILAVIASLAFAGIGGFTMTSIEMLPKPAHAPKVRPTSMTMWTLYFPHKDAKGEWLERSLVDFARDELERQLPGWTFIPAEGAYWSSTTHNVIRDTTDVYQIILPSTKEATKNITHIASYLASLLRQDEVYLAASPISLYKGVPE